MGESAFSSGRVSFFVVDVVQQTIKFSSVYELGFFPLIHSIFFSASHL